MGYIFLAIFIISTAVHLYGSCKLNNRIRNISKPFILLALIGVYVCMARTINWTVIVALAFSWLGDVLLIPKGNKWFTAGGISFIVSHLFFIWSYALDTDFTKVPFVVFFCFGLIFAILVCFIFSKLHNHLPNALFFPMLLYLLVNGAMNCFAIFRLFACQNPYTIMTVIGAILFFISDTSLFFVRFKKDSKLKSHFVVMLTYSIGELLIVLGLL